jgi:hypothetical protein
MEVNYGDRFENAIGIEQGNDDSTVEKKRGQCQKHRREFAKYGPEIDCKEQKTDTKSHVKKIYCVFDHGYSSST